MINQLSIYLSNYYPIIYYYYYVWIVAWEMCSFGETKMLKLCDKYPAEMIEYNIHQFSRIYPKGSRVDSSNYNPTLAWSCGSQMVALNYQTSSEPMWVNDAKYMDNGGCGYVLKEPFLLHPGNLKQLPSPPTYIYLHFP